MYLCTIEIRRYGMSVNQTYNHPIHNMYKVSHYSSQYGLQDRYKIKISWKLSSTFITSVYQYSKHW